ncbi:3-hexulose-6-phosphate synthase [Olsenella sp. HMSC062G07]|uniref:3-hexulose-6-phosphate synthase n=1 Tax=Olsenella sp. HMSC062G07 TaxID=1739330 RepID=UPI0008A436F4|nr:3-hexulose-6-phosphate synthase [Olsenella sp. HMSC062G07]OFK23890.1 3-hexulose-6-phosphate synthase [Olsenella sp. HMSC062G07]
MKLQLALDEFELDEALAVADKVRDSIDIIEMGTPFMLRYGLEAIRRFVAAFPEKEILCDVKIMDGGRFESDMVYDAGAAYCTVLGVTDDATIKGAVESANAHGTKSVVDMICVPDLAGRVRECEKMGVHVLAVHVGTDAQALGRTPLDDLKVMTATARRAEVAVAGGITSKTIDQYVALGPGIVICGGAIAHADDPVAEAKAIKKAMEA